MMMTTKLPRGMPRRRCTSPKLRKMSSIACDSFWCVLGVRGGTEALVADDIDDDDDDDEDDSVTHITTLFTSCIVYIAPTLTLYFKTSALTLSSPVMPDGYTSWPYWSKPAFYILEIRVLDAKK